MSYTRSAVPAAEAAIRELLDSLRAEIGTLKVREHILAVILGGGYGRGEGGATAKGKLYNDLDFFVISDKACHASEIAAALLPLAEKWSGVLGIDIDFCRPKTLAALRRDAGTLMLCELVAGHETIYGSPSPIQEIPVVEWSNLDWREGARLLLNRGSGLFFASEKSPDETDFIRRNIAKAVLGCGDALLIGAHDYRRTGDERAQALEAQAFLPELALLYREALDFKYTPGADKILPGWETARDLWEASLKLFSEMVTGRPCADPWAACRALRYMPCSAPAPGTKGWKNVLLNCRYAPLLPGVRPLTGHPRLKLLEMLAELLRFRHPEIRTAYRRLWARFN